MTMRYSGDDDTLFTNEISDMKRENWTVDSPITAFTFAPE